MRLPGFQQLDRICGAGPVLRGWGPAGQGHTPPPAPPRPTLKRPRSSPTAQPLWGGPRNPAAWAPVSAGLRECRSSFPQAPTRAPCGFRRTVGLNPRHGESEGTAGPRAPGCREIDGGVRARPRPSGPGGGPSAGLGWRSREEGKAGAPGRPWAAGVDWGAARCRLWGFPGWFRPCGSLGRVSCDPGPAFRGVCCAT